VLGGFRDGRLGLLRVAPGFRLLAAATLASSVGTLARTVSVAPSLVSWRVRRRVGFGNGSSKRLQRPPRPGGAPDRLRGRAFSVIMSIGYAPLGLGGVAAGPLRNELGARTAWRIAAVPCGAGAAAGFLMLRRRPEREAAIPLEEPAHVRERV
jgi:MFS family permease